jgi:hypothetical protein
MSATTPKRIQLKELMLLDDLTWKAKALAVTIALLRDEFTNPNSKDKTKALSRIGPEGFSSVKSGLDELKRKQLLQQTICRNPTPPHFVHGSTWEIMVDLGT